MIIRQSTARTIMVGPVLDADGVAVTDAVVGDMKCSKNGGAPAALDGSATLTHRHTGFYSLALTATDTDTVGSAQVTIDDTVNCCPMATVTVIEEAVYDAYFAASALGYVANAPVNVAQLSGDSAAADNAEAFFDGTGYAGTNNVIPTVTAVTTVNGLAANTITATSIASDALTAAKFAADCITAAKIADGAIDAATFAAGAITAAAIAADAIDADALAANAVTEIQSGLATAAGITALDGKIDTIDNFLDTEIAAILADTNELQTDWADGGRLDLILDARASQASVDTVDDFLDTEVAAILAAVDTEIAAIKAKTDNLPASPAATGDAMALTAGERSTLAAAILDLADAIESGVTLRGSQRLILASLAGKLSGAATATVTIRNVGDSKDRITATVDESGNRTAVTTDAT
jgi:hypothetical protein